MGKFVLKSTRASGWKIGSVEFDTAPVWTDERKYNLNIGSKHELLGGDTVLQVFAKNLKGTPITLKLDGKEGSLHKSRADSLKTLADTGAAVNFTPGTGQAAISCYFDYSKDSPIDLEYLPDGNRTMMIGAIYLIRAS
jgi:hypothetical protein